MTRSWAELPKGRVIRLYGANADTIALSIDPLPEDAPAIVTYFADGARSAGEMVTSVLGELERAAIGLFPAWLPGAENIGVPGGAGARAVRVLARQMASVTGHFGPFLAELAELSLRTAEPPRRIVGPSRRGTGPSLCTAEPPRRVVGPSVHDAEPSHRGAGPFTVEKADRAAGFAPEVRAAGLARVLAASFGRPHTSVLVRVPDGLSAAAEEVLVAGCEWLAHRGELGVWLTGAPLTAVDRVEAMTVRLPAEVTSLARDTVESPSDARTAPAVAYPAVAGLPHPASDAEQALETALARYHWAAGRAWNQTHRSHPLTNPIRVDLLWHEERCVVEVDGPEHRTPLMFAADRRRDVQLQLDGYAVLRFTNEQVLTDTETVVHQIMRLLRNRRLGTLEG